MKVDKYPRLPTPFACYERSASRGAHLDRLSDARLTVDRSGGRRLRRERKQYMQCHGDRSLREGGTRRRGSERKEKTHLQAHASLAVGPY